MTAVIEARGLVKHYGDVVALDGFDLSVEKGTVVGLLGPNGAGKTTVVSILTTLLIPDRGTATVDGLDVFTSAHDVRSRIGLSGQYAAVDEHLTGFENLDMIGRLYHLGKAKARTRSRELLEQFDLVESGDRPVKTYSGGMRRRLDLAGALVAQPPILFLDEPTTGLDPRSRIQLWEVIRNLVTQGTTLLLTTQYLEEADQLADDIIVIDHGREIAHGTSDELKTQVGGERIAITVRAGTDLGSAAALLRPHANDEIHIDKRSRSLSAPITGGAATLTAVIRSFDTAKIEIRDVGIRRPTLDDVFLALTGHTSDYGDSGEHDETQETR
ncbi:MAG: ATP-binding cassette domain-containing protein [Armatimonadetes bacterium]|nr:MAG: ATP-binding cassette domain-containing protein [Armatimonadota bacterium]